LRRLVDDLVVVGLQPDPDLLTLGLCHVLFSRIRYLLEYFDRSAAGYLRPTLRAARCRGCYLMTLMTTPEPTVRPPSRMAKRRPSSMAIGFPSETCISVLSPGMTISVPSGNT